MSLGAVFVGIGTRSAFIGLDGALPTVLGKACGKGEMVDAPAMPRGGEWKAPGGVAGDTTRGGAVGGGGGTRAPASNELLGELGGIVERGPLLTGDWEAAGG